MQMLSVTSRGMLLRLPLCALTVFSLSSCATEVTLSSVSDSAVSGTWKASDGGAVNLKTDRTFTTSGIDWHAVSEETGCPQGATKGTWAFWGSDPETPDMGAALDKYKSGDTINLSFEEPLQQEGCMINLNVTKGGSSLCVSDDIEIPCSREINLTKEEAKTRP
ncbi:hypothetical protein ACIQUL_23585 [Streptomyces sp. NPDC090303]|uniref:hypothetical protein n=1 Tax=Streptomyces sp. NPDC090303 TaxID=3365960 RepID=UPI0038217E34